MYTYGTTILEALARSDLTGPGDKAILDTVWAGSYTKMRDKEIRDLVAKCRAVVEGEIDEPMPEHSLRRDLDRQRGIEDPPASGEDEPARRSRVSNAKGFDPANRNQIFATLRREILAARLKVTLGEQLDRETSPTVKGLAGMKLQPLARHQRGDYVQPDAAGRDTSSE